MRSCSPCAACKLLRRRCAEDCIFAPYFPSQDPHRFAIVHKIFGASNELPVDQRGDAASSMVYEANARVRDPVYGCVGAISYLQNQVSQLQMQLTVAQTELLCIKMQQDSPSPPYLAPTNNFNNIDSQPEYLNFPSSTNVIQDPSLKTESIWT
ncbi:LOB domain-containing protein 12-like [Gossypium australe]|uniref:LOB domain-containing protein 12-like n=1 Tax=Gossypium australe TaxID=47621 RepID=A0A5B6X894_9ROSI|nr:LOB domain-containing protein 12-like [Gossypium australe]